MTLIAFILLGLASIGGYMVNRNAALAVRNNGARLHSLSNFHGGYALLLVAVPGFLFLTLWLAMQGMVIDRMTVAGFPDAVGLGADGQALALSEVKSLARGQTFAAPEPWKTEAAARLVVLQRSSLWMMLAGVGIIAVAGIAFARSKVAADFRARQNVEGILLGIMIACSLLAILVTVGIVLSLSVESWRFFEMVPITEFLFGLNWEPQIPIRADQVAGSGEIGRASCGKSVS